MIWLLLAMIFSATIIMFGALASRNADSGVVAAIIGTVSAIVPVLLLLPELGKRTIQTNKLGITMSILTGVAVAFYSIAVAKSYAANKVAVVIPIVFGGAIVLSTLASYLFFKEKVGWMQGCGLLLIVAGFCVVIFARAYAK